jgi:hypothetical protein
MFILRWRERTDVRAYAWWAVRNLERVKLPEAGGLLGHVVTRNAKLDHCYWDDETSGKTEAAGNKGSLSGAQGLSTAEFQSGLPKGFDKHIWAENSETNGGFPFLVVLRANKHIVRKGIIPGGHLNLTAGL